MKYLLFLLILIFCINCLYGQTINEDILKLLRISGTNEMVEQTWNALITQYQQLLPSVPSVFWFMARENVRFEDLLYDAIPVYAKYYTNNEIKQLISFYESPIGKKMTEVSILMSNDLMLVGQRWGERLGQLIINELTREGYLR